MIDYEAETNPEPFPWPLLILLALYTPFLILKEHPKPLLTSFLLFFAYAYLLWVIVWAVKAVWGV